MVVFAGNTYYLSHHTFVDGVDTAQVVRLPRLPHKSVVAGDRHRTPAVSYYGLDLHSQAPGAVVVGVEVQAAAGVALAVVSVGLGLAGGAVRVRHVKFGG